MKLVDLELQLKMETDKAYLVNDGDKDVWLPKSQVEHSENKVFTMPEWLAIEKELV